MSLAKEEHGMGFSEGALRGIPSENNYEYRRLQKEHRSYEERLEEFCKRPYLSPQEQMEVTNLKKAKLRIKDRMEQLIRQHRASP
jgi:uncharacterized protein YdcH (DUF465 family)